MPVSLAAMPARTGPQAAARAVPSPWPLALGLLGWLAGLAVLQMQAQLPTVGPLAAGLGGVALLWLAARRWAGTPWAALALLLGFALGLSWATWRAHERLQQRLDPAWEGRDLLIQARVAGLPTALEGFGGASGWRLALQLEGGSAQDPHSGSAVPLPSGASLTWFEGKGRDVAPRAGERWRFTVRLKPVHAHQNPGLPDTELWLLERGVRLQGSVRSGERLAPAPWWDVHALRERVRNAIQRQVDDPRQRAVLAGLVIGDQAALPASDWALLRDAGVVHLFSISGLHITVFAWAVGWLVRAAWRRSPRLVSAWATPAAARWLGLLAALGYAVLSGWGVPAQRTVGLLAVLALLASSGRRWPWPLALLLAGAVVGAGDPWALVQPGFWLSFVAVGVLMHAGSSGGGEAGPRALTAVHELLRTQAVVTVGLLPLTLLFFGQVSVVGVVANLLAVPLVTLALVPLALAGVLLPWAWVVAGWLVQGLWAVLQPLAGLPWAVLALPQAPSHWMALALAGTAVALLRGPRLWRVLGLLCWLPMLLHSPPRPEVGSFRLMVIDVGQGSAVWLQTAQHNLLLDAGPRWGPMGHDAGSRTVLPLLRAHGVRHLDVLAISHADSDHSGGAASVAAGLSVGEVVGSLPPGHPLAARARPCEAGHSWQWGGVRLRWLHPLPGESARATNPTTNATACVLQVQDAHGRTALLTTDIEAAQEAELLARSAPGSLAADLLLVPHHGSNTSSTAAFIAAVQPSLALAQSGHRNRHGHPALPVVQRYHAAGVPLITSAGCGAFDWWSASGPPSPALCRRAQAPRYWHNPTLVNEPAPVADPFTGPERSAPED
jgi:competence protein ComEC